MIRAVPARRDKEAVSHDAAKPAYLRSLIPARRDGLVWFAHRITCDRALDLSSPIAGDLRSRAGQNGWSCQRPSGRRRSWRPGVRKTRSGWPERYRLGRIPP